MSGTPLMTAYGQPGDAPLADILAVLQHPDQAGRDQSLAALGESSPVALTASVPPDVAALLSVATGNVGAFASQRRSAAHGRARETLWSIVRQGDGVAGTAFVTPRPSGGAFGFDSVVVQRLAVTAASQLLPSVLWWNAETLRGGIIASRLCNAVREVAGDVGRFVVRTRLSGPSESDVLSMLQGVVRSAALLHDERWRREAGGFRWLNLLDRPLRPADVVPPDVRVAVTRTHVSGPAGWGAAPPALADRFDPELAVWIR